MSSDRKPFFDEDEETTNVGSKPQEATQPDFTLSDIKNLEADFARTFGEVTNPVTPAPSEHSQDAIPEYESEPQYQPETDYPSESRYRLEPKPADRAEPQPEPHEDVERTFVGAQKEVKEEPVAKAFDEATRVISAPFAGLAQRRAEEDTAKTRFADDTTDKIIDETAGKIDSRAPFSIRSQHSNPAFELPEVESSPASRFHLSKPKRILIFGGIGILAALYFLFQPTDTVDIQPDQEVVAAAAPEKPHPMPTAAPIASQATNPAAPTVQAGQVETLLYQFHTVFHQTQTQAHRKTSP